MPVRRHANPHSVQHVWNAIRSTQLQKQDNNTPKLIPYLQKVFQCTAQAADTYIQQVVKDNLLVNNQKTGTKVPKGSENYRIPTTENNTPVDDGYDWYCIECHQAGDVTCCQTCHRVFHLECARKPINNRVNINEHSPSSLKNRTLDVSKSNSLLSTIDANKSNDETLAAVIDDDAVHTFCSVCRMLRNEKTGLIERDELNYLLTFTLNRIRIWLPANITDVMAPSVASPWMTEQEVAWRVRQLLYQTMDIPLMEMKLRTKEYTKLGEFHADVITIQHNVAVFHGVESQEHQGSELMITDSKYDLVELQQCVDCYRHSNEKRNEMWFCIPCRPPHQIVWAKQKGYPYWPAKIIRNTPNGQYDVRFFGAKHLRAIIEKSANLQPIETNPQKLQVKRTIPFNKALQELTEYQRLLTNPDEVQKIMSEKADLKQKSPGNKNKPSKVRKPKEPPTVTLDEDVYEFTDSLLKVMDPEPPQTPEKKKRGRKVGPKTKKAKPIKTSTPKVPSLATIKLSPDRQESVDSNLVSSSTENINSYGRPNLSIESNSNLSFRSRSASGSGSSGTQQLERVYSDPVEDLRRQLEAMSAKDDKDQVIRTVLEAMQLELDRMQSAHSEHLRSMVDAQNVAISEIKKKQWCFNCEQEAIYHCCWNTAYCSTTCQQQHWQSEHKKTCRRKR